MVSPLSKYNDEHKDRWDILVDFPTWERESILDWVWGVVHTGETNRWGHVVPEYNPSVITDIQKNERIMFVEDLDIPYATWTDLEVRVRLLMSNDPEKLLILIELLVKHIRNDDSSYHSFGVLTESSNMILNRLERVLSNGSKWKVVTTVGSPSGLIERVDPHITDMAQAAKSKHLDDAWSHAFGPSPKPEQAIVDAQLAIEHAASESGLTNATTKVFGTLLGDIKARLGKSYVSSAKPEYDKGLELIKAKDTTVVDNEFASWFASGLDLIQKTNPTRHASKQTNGFAVSVDAARQAVLVATLLNEMIVKGYIKKAGTQNK